MMNDYKKNIFLVDDDEDDREFFKYAVMKSEASICLKTFNDSVQLLDHLKSDKHHLPDLIFLDTQMPRMSGIECLQEIRNNKDWQNIPVVMYTTSPDKSDLEEAMATGANLYVKKPYDFFTLVRIVRYVATVDWETRKPYSTDIYFDAFP